MALPLVSWSSQPKKKETNWKGITAYRRNFMYPFGEQSTFPGHIELFGEMRHEKRCPLAIASFGFVPGDTFSDAYRIL